MVGNGEDKSNRRDESGETFSAGNAGCGEWDQQTSMTLREDGQQRGQGCHRGMVGRGSPSHFTGQFVD